MSGIVIPPEFARTREMKLKYLKHVADTAFASVTREAAAAQLAEEEARAEHPGTHRQAPPEPCHESPAIADLVMADMEERKQHGIQTYGMPLRAFNGRDPLVDAYQEALDLAVYLRQQIFEQYGR